MKERERTCKYCKQEITIKPGAHNWKNLFRKPTLDEWITLFIIIMVILSSYAYRHDINSLTDFYTKGDYCNQEIQLEQLERDYNALESEEFLDSNKTNFGDGTG